MRTFSEVKKVFIKSNNSTIKIFNRYLYCLIPFILFYLIYNSIFGDIDTTIVLLKHTVISLIISILTEYIIKLIKKEKDIHKLLLKDNILTISLIISLCSQNSTLIVTVLASIISIVIRNIFKNNTISSSLYGILLILIFSYFNNDINTPLNNLKELSYINTFDNIIKPYGNILSLSLGTKYYLSPIISILVFIYLFYKKSIKYNITISYILTFSFIMLFIGLFNNMNIWYLFFHLSTGNILFLSIFCLTDYPNTPITSEGQVIYGMILGLITGILRFIIPELSVIIPIILGPILLIKKIDTISIKLKSSKKKYYIGLSICSSVVLITTIIINIIL